MHIKIRDLKRLIREVSDWDEPEDTTPDAPRTARVRINDDGEKEYYQCGNCGDTRGYDECGHCGDRMSWSTFKPYNHERGRDPDVSKRKTHLGEGSPKRSKEDVARQREESRKWRESPEGKEAIRKYKASASKNYRRARKENPEYYERLARDRAERKKAVGAKADFDPTVGGEYDNVDLQGRKSRQYRPGTQDLIDMEIWRGDNW